MRFPCSQHRHFDFIRLVYMAGEESTEKPSGGGAAKPEVQVLKFEEIKPGENYKYYWREIDKVYGENAYSDIITDYVTDLLPNAPDYRMALAVDSLRRYKDFYKETYKVFKREAADIEDAFEDAVEDLVDRTSGDLEDLRNAVEGSRVMSDFTKDIPSPKNKAEVMDYFEGYLEALEKRYLNEELDEGNEGHDDYDDKSDDLQSKMEAWTKGHLSRLLEKGASAETLKAFKDKLTGLYQRFASYDENSAIISSPDLKKLNEEAYPPPDVIGKIMNGTDAEALRRMELMQIMNPEAWRATLDSISERIVLNTMNNGFEKEFVAAVKKHRKFEGDDFGDAENTFYEITKELYHADVRTALAFFQEFHSDAYGDVLKYTEDVEERLKVQVKKQIDYLLKGDLDAYWDEDKMVVKFLTANREEKYEILSNNASRDTLFRGIRLAEGRYQEEYQNQSGGGQERSRRRINIEAPTSDDERAQHKALMILGLQAREIVSKLSQSPEFANMKLMKKLERTYTPKSDERVVVATKFQRPIPQRKRFRNSLERSGFNFMDLGLVTAKGFAVVGLIANGMQAWSETQGQPLDERFLGTIEGFVSNPSVAVLGAVTVGSHMIQRHPEFAKYPWLSKFDRERVKANFWLRRIAIAVGPGGFPETKRFVRNDEEYSVLANENMNQSAIQKLLEDADKEAAEKKERTGIPYKAVITTKAIKEVVPLAAGLTTGGKSARIRYLFYKRLCSGSNRLATHQLKQIFTNSSYIPMLSESEEQESDE